MEAANGRRFDVAVLREATTIVRKAAASRAALPILSNVLIEAADVHIELVATDLEIGMKCVVSGQIITPGSITLPAKKLLAIVREVPLRSEEDEPMMLKLMRLTDERVQIDCGKAKFRLVGIAADEFPPLPDPTDGFMEIDVADLYRLVRRTAFAVSTDETRYFLQGVYLTVKDDLVTMVASDGKRLAVATQAVLGAADQEGVIIPIKAANRLLQSFSPDDKVRIGIVENQIVFATDNMVVVSRLIDGEYVDCEAVVTSVKDNKIEVIADTQQLLAVIKRVSLVAYAKSPMVRLTVTTIEDGESVLHISASDPAIGEGSEQMPVEATGDIEIGFNARFLMDILKNVESKEIVFKLRDAVSPGLLRPRGDYSYQCIIMPMKL